MSNFQLSETEHTHLAQVAERLRREFDGQLNTETVQRLLDDSVATLAARARHSTWVPLLAERFARDRLRAVLRMESQDQPNPKPSILFLCVHNAGRSQMAAGFARSIGGDQVDVFSGGSEPAGAVNAVAVEAMAEKGIDIREQIPQPWSDEIVRAADVVVTMGCADACPVFPGKRYVDWELEDPAGRGIEDVRRIRDDIERRVTELLGQLGA
ncbi:MAG: three-helix bundle dimerization domain-containing protein [Acidimicrobiia bacterium]